MVPTKQSVRKVLGRVGLAINRRGSVLGIDIDGPKRSELKTEPALVRVTFGSLVPAPLRTRALQALRTRFYVTVLDDGVVECRRLDELTDPW